MLIEELARLLFPPRCLLCREILTDRELDLCKTCRIEAPDYKMGKNTLHFLDSFAAVWYYEGKVRTSLLRFKFHGARHLAKGYGRLLAMAICREGLMDADYLTWIPVSRRRKLARGYDQVELIARAVGRELRMKPVPLLKKVRHNPAQSGLRDLRQRQLNVQGVYRLRPGVELKNKRILLLDDIVTTGATAGEAAKVLRSAGAREIHCAAVAAARK